MPTNRPVSLFATPGNRSKLNLPTPTDADIANLLEGGTQMCRHETLCPSADAPDRDAARVVSSHPEQGWSLLCNGVVLFDDTGELLPTGEAVAPHQRCAPTRAFFGLAPSVSAA